MEEFTARILIVDDDDQLTRLVEQILARDDFATTTVDSGEQALAVWNEAGPDLAVVDLNLPGMSGFDLLDDLRHRGVDTPVIILTGDESEGSRVVGLDSGADDYVVKPFSPRELSARVRAILRRSGTNGGHDPLTFGNLTIDPLARIVEADGETIELTQKEFDLLALLASNPGRAFTYDEILASVWDSRREWQSVGTITEHVRRLRVKLGDDPEQSRITNLRGVGYRFDP